MLRHVLEERLRLGEDVSGHGRHGREDLTRSAEASTDASRDRKRWPA
jgi:hypothetical protein